MKKLNTKYSIVLQIFILIIIATHFLGCKEDVSFVRKNSFAPAKQPQLIWSIVGKKDSVLKVKFLFTDSGSRLVNKIEFEYFEDSLFTSNKKYVILNPIIDKPLEIDIIELRQIKKYWGRVVIATDIATMVFNPRELFFASPLYPMNTIHCNTSSPTFVTEVLNPKTGRIWMDRNLGANRVATQSNDALAYGDLYQWGRRADGHQCRNSIVSNLVSSSDQPQQNTFITSAIDWRSPSNNNLWQGVSGINNPCPNGFRIPTEVELNAEISSWTTKNAEGAFASPLKLTLVGYRNNNYGWITGNSISGEYWSSTVSSNMGSSRYLFFNSNSSVISTNSQPRSYGFAVRCIKQ